MDILSIVKKFWGWSGLKASEIVAENDFGNLVVVDQDGKYWRICPEDAYCEVIAESKSEMDALLQDEEFVDDWYLEAFTDEVEKRVGPLKEGMKYCFVVPPVVGGEYELSNVSRIELEELLELSGILAEKIEALPDGTEVTLDELS